MESLTPSAKGRWEARDLDSLHILDLEAATYERRPLPRKDALDGFDDHVSYHLLDEVIEWPRVGGRFLIRCTVRADPWRRHRVHQSATITQITRAPRAVDELAHTLPGSPMIRIPSGWCALVNQLHAELIELEPLYIATSVKEKHNRMRFYIAIPDSTPIEVAATMYARIDWAQGESGNRCTLCGGPILTAGGLCDRHP